MPPVETRNAALGAQVRGALEHDRLTLTGGTQANVSRHLQTLTGAHILARRKEGLQVFYAIADPSIFKLCELVCGSLEKSLHQQADALGGGR